ncbi:MAG: heme exporter protein CcmB [Acidobacteria bacterium]|nr:heme exporter protein CcmB [Acidobacteriota bacterium]
MPNLILLMLSKDLRRELRSKEVFLSSFLFSLILLCIFYYAATSSSVAFEKLPNTALWICIAFSGTIGLHRTHQAELQNACYKALMMAPRDPGLLFLAKFAANATLLTIMSLLLLPLIALFFNLDLGSNLLKMIPGLVLGIAGFVAIGTLTVVISANTRISDILFPIIHLPLVVPVLIAGVNCTQKAMLGEISWTGIQILCVLNLVFLSLGFMTYAYLLEE